MVGPDLPSKEKEMVKAHLKSCPRCNREYESYLLTFQRTKEWLDKSREDWQEKEWQGLISKALQKEEPVPSFRLRWRLKMAWDYALLAGAVVILSLFIIRYSLLKDRMDMGVKEEKTASMIPGQESISMTMVSQETGLKIVWFFNKNFELKEER